VNGSEPSGLTKGRKFHDLLNDYQKVSAPFRCLQACVFHYNLMNVSDVCLNIVFTRSWPLPLKFLPIYAINTPIKKLLYLEYKEYCLSCSAMWTSALMCVPLTLRFVLVGPPNRTGQRAGARQRIVPDPVGWVLRWGPSDPPLVKIFASAKNLRFHRRGMITVCFHILSNAYIMLLLLFFDGANEFGTVSLFKSRYCSLFTVFARST
jgi:hypothetical protein